MNLNIELEITWPDGSRAVEHHCQYNTEAFMGYCATLVRNQGASLKVTDPQGREIVMEPGKERAA
jgi:hypothetical protein